MQGGFPFPRVPAEFAFHQGALRLAKKIFGVRVNLLGVLASLVMRAERRLKPRAGVVTRVVRINACGIAERCSDGDLARDVGGRKRNRRADIARRRDSSLRDDADGIFVAKNNGFDRSRDTAAPDLFAGMVGRLRGMNKKGANRKNAQVVTEMGPQPGAKAQHRWR